MPTTAGVLEARDQGPKRHDEAKHTHQSNNLHDVPTFGPKAAKYAYGVWGLGEFPSHLSTKPTSTYRLQGMLKADAGCASWSNMLHSSPNAIKRTWLAALSHSLLADSDS